MLGRTLLVAFGLLAVVEVPMSLVRMGGWWEVIGWLLFLLFSGAIAHDLEQHNRSHQPFTISHPVPLDDQR